MVNVIGLANDCFFQIRRLEDEANNNVQEANNKIQLLEDDMNDMNTKIEDVSKQQGPQGPPGPEVRIFTVILIAIIYNRRSS